MCVDIRYIYIYKPIYILATSTVDEFVTTISYFSSFLQYLDHCSWKWLSRMSANVGDNWFHQLFNLFHDFGKVFVQFYVGSKQFPTYLSILPWIFCSCPTYFMIVPLFSFNFHPISVKMYHSITYIHTYLPTYVHTYIPTYPTYLPYLPTLPTYLRTYVRMYVCIYVYTKCIAISICIYPHGFTVSISVCYIICISVYNQYRTEKHVSVFEHILSEKTSI